MVQIAKSYAMLPQRETLARALRFFARNYTLTVGIALLALMVLAAIVAPLITSYDPLTLDAYNRLTPPSGDHWFGTDHLGRDVYTRTIYGTRISLLVGGMAAFITVIIGAPFGLVAGYYRVMDAVIMRIMDALMSLPTLLLAIALMAMLGSSLQNVIIATTIVSIPRMTRIVRASVLALRELAFVEAASVIGARSPRILLYHIFPNTLAPLIIQATYVFASAVLVEAALSFLGAGSPPFIPSWGNIMTEGRPYFQRAIWITLFPGLFLTASVLAVNVIGDCLRDILDPKLRGRL